MLKKFFERFMDVLPTSILAFALGFLIAQMMAGHADQSAYQFIVEWFGRD